MVRLIGIICFLAPEVCQAFLLIRAGVYNKGARPVANAVIWEAKTVQFVINTNLSAHSGSNSLDISSSDFQTAAEAAIAAWAEACNANVTVSLTGTTTSTKDSSDSVNVISYDNRTNGEGNVFGADTSTLAAAFSATLSDDTYVECDIVVNGNSSSTFGISGESAKIDLVSTLTHEIGHCLGLDHPVESGSYTSNNSILNNATMTTGVAVGEIFRRTINRDDVDGVECVYPIESGTRTGVGCSSYHGTDGGAAITGVVSGGPSDSAIPACLEELDTTTIKVKPGETGGGCFTKAFAMHPKNLIQNSDWVVELVGSAVFWPPVLFLIHFSFRFFRKRSFFWIFLLGFFGSGVLGQNAYSASYFLTASGEVRKGVFSELNHFLEISEAVGVWSSEIDQHEPYRYDTSLTLHFGVARSNRILGFIRFQYGGYLRYHYPREFIHKRKTGGRSIDMTKTTKISGFVAGPFVRFHIFGSANHRLFLELAAGAGKVYLDQTIEGTSTSTLTASAFSGEVMAAPGLQIKLIPNLTLEARVGVSRQQSNYVTVESADGSHYPGFDEEDKLFLKGVDNEKEFQVIQTGVFSSLGLVFFF